MLRCSVPELKLIKDMPAAGDQPRAIGQVVDALNAGEQAVTLMGVTGSGKTRTMAGIIEAMQRPTLVMAPNKLLAAQLANEFRELFPENAVEYFVSYYDYYQPEAYVPQTDTYIEKDSSLNEEIDRLRHSSTAALLSRRDVIIVASVSCIYALGSPEEYREQMLFLKTGEEVDRDQLLRKLVDLHYERNDFTFSRGRFRARGDTLEVYPAYEERAVRIELFGDEIERMLWLDPVTGEVLGESDELVVFSASHYVAGPEKMERAIAGIEAELAERLAELERESKLLEAQRLRMRTSYDLEMLREVGFTNGIENYSRHIDGRAPGEPPYTLLDYFPDDFLLFMDESHNSVPQVGGMYEGDRSRKQTLVDHGFRLPSALDNRPLRFDEFLERIGQRVFVSATPGPYELRESGQIVEQIIRPTGLVDPEVLVRPTKGQVDDLIEEIRKRAAADQRVLVTTLTKKMAEDLTDYLIEMGLRVRYLHSEIDTVERIEILRDLRMGEFDALVGINLLREGLDLPEVTLVAILDADKEGFLRSETSLIQTIGRAARNVDGQVIMYADQVTPSMQRAINETNRRRQLQLAYNREHGIDPQTIRRRVTDIIQQLRGDEAALGGRGKRGRQRVPDLGGRRAKGGTEPAVAGMPRADLERLIQSLEEEMHEAAKDLRFEYAARLRDEVADLRRELRGMQEAGVG
jgi:excinuclease ABC subunit B